MAREAYILRPLHMKENRFSNVQDINEDHGEGGIYTGETNTPDQFFY
jgi:hypothetical protein